MNTNTKYLIGFLFVLCVGKNIFGANEARTQLQVARTDVSSPELDTLAGDIESKLSAAIAKELDESPFGNVRRGELIEFSPDQLAYLKEGDALKVRGQNGEMIVILSHDKFKSWLLGSAVTGAVVTATALGSYIVYLLGRLSHWQNRLKEEVRLRGD